MDLMSIGEFARLSRLSAKALRLYDELGLLPPAQVDPDSGYRWYAAGQLDNARLVASLRQIGVPLAQIRLILSLEPDAAAAQVGAYWSGSEADHAARRSLAGYLVDRLTGKKRNVMYEVKVRDIPARSLLCLLRHASNEQAVWDLGKEVIGMLKARPTPRVEGVAGAAFLIYYGEVNQDSDGPVEFCWPVPQDLAGELAAGFPALTLRTEPAHQEACISGQDAERAAQSQLLDDPFKAWAAEHQREPGDLPLRVTLLTTAAPVTDASKRAGFDFAFPLRDRPGAA